MRTAFVNYANKYYWYILFGCAALVFGAGFALVEYENHFDGRRASKRAELTRALAPTISEMQRRLVKSPAQISQIRLFRPYVFVYMGDIDGGAGSSNFRQAAGVLAADLYEKGGGPHSVADISVADIVTLVFLKDELIGSQTYVWNSSGEKKTLLRHRYYLWAFDVRKGTLGAYKILEDPVFKPRYNSTSGDKLMYYDLQSWAESVTEPPPKSDK